jgi:glycosyltransferase involved in cell wall biosynthesis
LHDGPFERGKCGYKLIQYMAVGRPVIGSPVGANCQIVRHGINGYLADSIQDWTDAILKLVRAPELLEDMGRAARDTVEREYSTRMTAPRIAGIFDDAVARIRSAGKRVPCAF